MSKKRASKRTEKDALGKVKIASSAPRGIYTQRVLNTYPHDNNPPVPELFLRTYLEAKIVYATVNARFRKISQETKRAIHKATKHLLSLPSEQFMDYFPIGQIQGGGGTATNMMINEVLANEATVLLGGKYGQYLIDSHDHCNASQSSNDTFPGVTKLTLLQLVPQLLESIHSLEKACKKIARRGRSVKKVGRTHLQDAVVITLGDEFGAYARTLNKNKKYLQETSKALKELNFGASATGSLQNISLGMRKELIRESAKIFKQSLQQPNNYFEQTSSSGDVARFMQAINHCANDLFKIGNDLRLLSSGPLAGFYEITLPAVQPGSSIMPGKVNPSVVESATMLFAQIHGANQIVQLLTRQAQLQLQQFIPQIAWSTIEATQSLTIAIQMLSEQCIQGITINKKRIAWLLDHSLAGATDFSEEFGYEKVAAAVVQALKTGKPLQEILKNP